jgi:hypothetical protein
MGCTLSDSMTLNSLYELQILLALDADVSANLTSYLIWKKLISLFIRSFINPIVPFKNDFQCKKYRKGCVYYTDKIIYDFYFLFTGGATIAWRI